MEGQKNTAIDDKDEIIAKLRRELSEKDRIIEELR